LAWERRIYLNLVTFVCFCSLSKLPNAPSAFVLLFLMILQCRIPPPSAHRTSASPPPTVNFTPFYPGLFASFVPQLSSLSAALLALTVSPRQTPDRKAHHGIYLTSVPTKPFVISVHVISFGARAYFFLRFRPPSCVAGAVL